MPLKLNSDHWAKVMDEHSVHNGLKLATKTVRELGGGQPTVGFLVSAARKFADIAFGVPARPDSDGFLFQYSRATWHEQPTFAFGIVRQLELLDEDGEHDCYSQIQFDLNYPLDQALESVAPRSVWWFRNAAVETFDQWLEEVLGDPVIGLLRERDARSFELTEDQV